MPHMSLGCARDPFLAQCAPSTAADFAGAVFDNNSAEAAHFTAIVRACQQAPTKAACLAPQLAYAGAFTAVAGTTEFLQATPAGLSAASTQAAFLRGFRELLGVRQHLCLSMLTLCSALHGGGTHVCPHSARRRFWDGL